jgi:hypothetical protein
MMFCRVDFVAVTVSSGVHLADKPDSIQHIEYPVYGYHSYIRMVVLQPFVEVCRG